VNNVASDEKFLSKMME